MTDLRQETLVSVRANSDFLIAFTNVFARSLRADFGKPSGFDETESFLLKAASHIGPVTTDKLDTCTAANRNRRPTILRVSDLVHADRKKAAFRSRKNADATALTKLPWEIEKQVGAISPIRFEISVPVHLEMMCVATTREWESRRTNGLAALPVPLEGIQF